MARLLKSSVTANGRLLRSTVPSVSPPTINTISSAVEQGATGNFTASNLSTIVTWRLTDADGNSVDVTGTATSFDCPPLGDNQNLLTGTVTLTVIDDLDASASRTFELAVNNLYHEVRLTAGFDTGPESFLEGYDQNVEVGDAFFGLSSVITLRDDGTAVTNGPVTTTLYAFDRTDGQMQSFSYETGPLLVSNDLPINFQSVVYVSADLPVVFDAVSYVNRNLDISFGSSSSFVPVSINLDIRFETTEFAEQDFSINFTTSQLVTRNYSFIFGSDSLPLSTPLSRTYIVQ